MSGSSERALRLMLPALLGAASLPAGEGNAPPPAQQTPTFVDVAEESGVDLLTLSGTPYKAYIVESTTGGTSVFDYDNDGDVDIYIVNGSRLAGFAEAAAPRATLYRNDGNWRFFDVGATAGVDHAGWGMGCTAADYNADGWLDLYLTNYGPNALYRNGEGRFLDVAAEAGVAHAGWGSAAAFADFDGDDDVDFYLTNYVDFDPDYTPPDSSLCRWRGLSVFCGPVGLQGAADVFYRNDGPQSSWSFSVASAEFGLADYRYYGLGALAGDFDNDGDPDLYIANDSTPNVLYRNDDGRFHDTARISGVAYSENGLEQASMGIAAADYDADGDLDLFVTNFANDNNTLYQNMGGGFFFDTSFAAGLGAASFTELGWGAGFFDADNDGDQDLFVANGHVYPSVDDHGVGSSYGQRNQLFENGGHGVFSDVTDSAGPGFAIAESSRGSAFADFDNDGDLDLIVVNLDSRPTLLRNDGGNRGNWLKVQLRQPGHNTQAIGARVTVLAGGRLQMREARAGASYLSQNDARLHFGLMTEQVDQLTIRWPGGEKEMFTEVPVNRFIEIRRGHGLVVRPSSATEP